ncbi:MAG: DNA cytosine methyltransferase [Agriterribacter sp.]
MRHGSFFNGIGGFQIAALALGWTNVFHSEIDKWCNQVTKKNFPKSINVGNVQTADFTIFRDTIDIISGGDPCQPHSVAGLGKGTGDERFLWPEMFRATREILPAAVVNENVSGSVANGVLDLKIDDLESLGYSCQPYNIPAAAVGALHQRERIWLVAYHADRDAELRESRIIHQQNEKEKLQEWEQIPFSWEPVDLWIDDTDADAQRFKKQHATTFAGICEEGLGRYFGFGAHPHGNIPRDVIESGIIRMLDGLPEGMDYADRNKRIKALGNAIAWPVAYEIFRSIDLHN